MGNAAILRRWFEEVWNQGREATIDELLAPDALGHGLGEEPIRGPAGFKPFWSQLRGAFPDIHFTVEHTIEEGDMAAGSWTATMTHRGDHLGMPATNKALTLTGMVLVRVRDGRMVEGWNNWDQHLLNRELGLN